MEGTLYLKSDEKNNVAFVFDETVPKQTCQGVTLTLFQKVKVKVVLDQSNIQHEKLMLHLVEPKIPGFSVKESEGVEEKANGNKRKKSDVESNNRKKKIKK